MCRLRRSSCVFRSCLKLIALAAMAFAASGVALAASNSDGARLRIETLDEGRKEIWVDTTINGAPNTQLLRETSAVVVVGASGGAPRGLELFVTWNEDGQRWFSDSRDGGRSWSDADPVKPLLRLRDAVVGPAEDMPLPAPGLELPVEGRVFIVQFHSRGLPSFRSAITSLGAEVLQYFPYNAHIVRMSPLLRSRVESLEFVERIEPYHPSYRLDTAVRTWLEQNDGDTRRMRVMAFEWGSAGKSRIAAEALAMGSKIENNHPNGHVIEVWLNAEQARVLASHDDVLWMDFWSAPQNDMDLVRQDAGTDWAEDNYGYCGQGVRGEVLDSGVEDSHMDFDGIMLHGGNTTSSHGTNTYGIVFGNGDRDGDGNAQGTGHMPCAEQGISADYDSLGDRFEHTRELTESPYFASFQTNSWGGARTRSYNSTSHEMDDIIWRLDFAILQSQSNAGNQDSRPQAWAKNIISVGGVRHKNTLDTADDSWTGGASIGPAEDGRIKPDINYWYDSIYTTTTGNGYTSSFGGTSAATPESAGVLGLMTQMWSENVWGNDPAGNTVFERKPGAATIKALMINNAQQYDFDGEGHDLTRVHQGWGRPSVRLARERAASSFIVDQDTPLQVGEFVEYEVEVAAGESELKITMIYLDPPGTTSASMHRINDLNLQVTSPSGALYHGNFGLKSGKYSVTGGSPNDIDTVENVFVFNPQAGIWLVRIDAAEINQDAYLDTPESDAAFALVVTGATANVCVKPLVDFTATPNPANVGEAVFFDSTVSGGAGGPFTYAWDFDADGTIDSTEADPTYTYRRPHDGMVTLRAEDSEGCEESRDRPMTVNGPDLRLDAFYLVEVDGNGNGAVEPGEIWDLSVDIINLGNQSALAVQADLVFFGDPVGPVVLLSSAADYADIPAGASSSSTEPYRFQVGQSFPCGSDLYFSLVNIRSQTPANTYPDEIGAIRVLVGGGGPANELFRDGFETLLGWSSTGGGEWEIGAPQGKGGGASIPGQISNSDPSTAAEGSQVLGNDLSGQGVFAGNYEDNVSSWMTSPTIDASNAGNSTLTFFRWLNVFPSDVARLQVYDRNKQWTNIVEVTDGVQDDVWSQITIDVSAHADENPSLRFRFGLTSDGNLTQSGWNVDDFTLTAVDRNACDDAPRAVPGSVDGLTLSKSGGELALSWGADCAGSTTYGIYRGDLSTGYDSLSAEPGYCDVAANSTTIPNGPGSADFFLVVPNDGVFEGGYGKDSGDLSRAPPLSNICHPQDIVDQCAMP